MATSTGHRTADLTGRDPGSTLPKWKEILMLRDGHKSWGRLLPLDAPQLLLTQFIPSSTLARLPANCPMETENSKSASAAKFQTARCTQLFNAAICCVVKGTSPSWACPDPEESGRVSATPGAGDGSDFIWHLLLGWAQQMASPTQEGLSAITSTALNAHRSIPIPSTNTAPLRPSCLHFCPGA